MGDAERPSGYIIPAAFSFDLDAAMADDTALLRRLFAAAVAAADPYEPTLAAMPPLPKGRAFVFAIGKAAGPMAEACEVAWGDGAYEGVCVTPPGAEMRLKRIKGVVGAHPIPDQKGEAAARFAMERAKALGPDDLLLALISGGGSALAPLPARGFTLEDKRKATQALLASGAPIATVNAVRRRLSGIKGGRLAVAAYPAMVRTLIVSDIPGDTAEAVASGPTLPDPLSNEEVRSLASPYRSVLPSRVWGMLEDPGTDTLKPDDPRAPTTSPIVLVRARDALVAVRRLGEAEGLHVVELGDAVQGEARAVARDHAAQARRLRALHAGRPVLLLSGGETTVTVRGNGRGGRNSEYLLALALELDGETGIAGLAADTDGIDGCGPHAGAVFDGHTLARALAAGVDPTAALDRNDSLSVFDAAGTALVTGPTRTNVNDFRALIIR